LLYSKSMEWKHDSWFTRIMVAFRKYNG